MSGKESKAADLRLGDQAERGTGICEKNPSFLSRKMTAFGKNRCQVRLGLCPDCNLGAVGQ